MNAGPRAPMEATEALRTRGFDRSTPFVCPYPDCGVFAQHHWGVVAGLHVPLGDGKSSSRAIASQSSFVAASCEACRREVVFVDEIMIWPAASTAPSASPDMPAEVLADYDEARMIHTSSPRGAAALLRLALQKLLPHLGATVPSINDAIAELVKKGAIPQRVQEALDAVRVIGNEAVHPGELDLRDDVATVQAIFGLLNFIVEKAISEPKEVNRIFGTLPERKRDGISERDKSGPSITRL